MPPGLLVDGEHGNAVVAAIGAIHKPARPMNNNLSSGIVTFKVIRVSADGADDSHRRRLRVASERGHLCADIFDGRDETVAGVDPNVSLAVSGTKSGNRVETR